MSSLKFSISKNTDNDIRKSFLFYRQTNAGIAIRCFGQSKTFRDMKERTQGYQNYDHTRAKRVKVVLARNMN